MKSRETSTGIESYTEFAQSWPFTGMAIKSETRLAGKGNAGLLKLSSSNLGCWMTGAQVGTVAPSSAQTPCTSTKLGGVVFPYVLNNTESSWDLNGAQMPNLVSSNLYAGYADQSGSIRQFGDPTQITVDISEGGALKQRKVTTNEYQPAKIDGSNWQLGRLKKASVTSTQY